MTMAKKNKIPRQYSLVTLEESQMKNMNFDKKNPFFNEIHKWSNGKCIYVYLGEIPNQRGHCVVSGDVSGRIYSGNHIEFFRELDPDTEC